ncbi:MAG: hypothetical protein LAO24_23000 [Acidobacteriia bacterium]|nr:hypothetical protein [Terriglobia bacterium]
MKRMSWFLNIALCFSVPAWGQFYAKCPNDGCQWDTSTGQYKCTPQFAFGCSCLIGIHGDTCRTEGECQNGVCVLNAVVTGAQQLTKFPWLADVDSAIKMAASSNVPRAEEIIRNEQMIELARGVPVGRRAMIDTQAGKIHVMTVVTATAQGQETFNFWTEADGHTPLHLWIKDHPEPEEKLVITRTSWELSSAGVARANGAVPKYSKARQCVKKM